MIVFLTQQGSLAFRTEEQDSRKIPVPASATLIRRFDEETNPVLAEQIRTQTNRFTLTAANLLRDGVIVVPNPPGVSYQDRQRIQGLSQLITRLEQAAPPLTLEEIRLALLRLARTQRHLLRQQREDVIT